MHPTPRVSSKTEGFVSDMVSEALVSSVTLMVLWVGAKLLPETQEAVEAPKTMGAVDRGEKTMVQGVIEYSKIW